MLKTTLGTIALAATMVITPALAGEVKADHASVERVMSEWTPQARADAEKLIARYGMPDRVTDTILIWDVKSAAQQQAMVDMTRETPATAEAGDGGMVSR